MMTRIPATPRPDPIPTLALFERLDSLKPALGLDSGEEKSRVGDDECVRDGETVACGNMEGCVVGWDGSKVDVDVVEDRKEENAEVGLKRNTGAIIFMGDTGFPIVRFKRKGGGRSIKGKSCHAPWETFSLIRT